MSIHIKNGLFIDPVNLSQTKRDIYTDGNLIVGIGKPPANFKADQTINAKNQWIIPGLVDCQVRLREPGQAHKGTIASETQAAVANGITSLCIPPDTQPVIDNTAVVELIHHGNSKAGNLCNIYTIGIYRTNVLVLKSSLNNVKVS